MNVHSASFERLYQESDDPWRFRSRWYERRKRALTLACLPAFHYENAWEIGCSNGELTAALAPNCDRILATDGMPEAVEAAELRLREFPNVTILRRWVPEQWPEASFDLIVLSELAYYLNSDSLLRFAKKLAVSLSPNGHFLACHWRHPIADCELTGDEAHAILSDALPWRKTVHHIESDFLLDVWSVDGQSVAQVEGLL